MSSYSDLELSIVAIVLSIIAVYLHVPIKDIKIAAWLRQLGKIGGSSTTSGPGVSKDFVELMRESGKKVVIFYGSQTGTAEEYATRLAKEIKARYSLSSLVCNPEDYEFNVLDQLPSTSLAIFILATYGEGEPTDNATSLLDHLSTSLPPLPNLNYLIFGLGNSTYEHFCATSRVANSSLQAAGATRIGPLGEGDDDNSLEEDYLAWKELIFPSLESQLGWVEGGSALASIPDFEVRELTISKDDPRVYQGELSQQALTTKRGIHDAKNPFIAPVLEAKELFQGGDRNCVSVKFDIRGSGMKYTTGDHVGIWPLNPDQEVERFLNVLGLGSKRDQVIDIVSLDPALAKVPTPSPTTYESVLRYYLDISQLASRQAVHSFARFAPSERARSVLERLGTDRMAYHTEVAEKGLRLAEVLSLAAGDDITASPSTTQYTTWNVPFSHILSCVPRLQPRFYSISSSSRMYPDEIHVTVVVAKSRPSEAGNMIFGLGSNLLLNLKQAITGHDIAQNKINTEESTNNLPTYTLTGPRYKYHKNQIHHLPIHIRPSKFRLPKSVKIPLVLIGPGTGVSPYLAFLQDRLHHALRTKASKGASALSSWAPITLFYGCRRSDEDFLYREEWKEMERELGGVFRMFVAFSREGTEGTEANQGGKGGSEKMGKGKRKGKVYVQDLVRQERELVVESLVARKGYLYICGDAKYMAREVEATLEDVLGRAVGGGVEEGAREMRVLKERKRVLLDVWS